MCPGSLSSRALSVRRPWWLPRANSASARCQAIHPRCMYRGTLASIGEEVAVKVTDFIVGGRPRAAEQSRRRGSRRCLMQLRAHPHACTARATYFSCRCIALGLREVVAPEERHQTVSPRVTPAANSPMLVCCEVANAGRVLVLVPATAARFTSC